MVTGDSKFSSGSQEDSHDFFITTLDFLARELRQNQEGMALLKKFSGKEEYLRKFTYPR